MFFQNQIPQNLNYDINYKFTCTFINFSSSDCKVIIGMIEASGRKQSS